MKLGERGDGKVLVPTPGAMQPRVRQPARVAAKVREFLARDKVRVPRSVQPLNPGFSLLERMRADKVARVRDRKTKVREA